MVANVDDAEGKNFLRIAGRGGAEKIAYSLADAEGRRETAEGVAFSYEGEPLASPLVGAFNTSNILAAVAFARTQGAPFSVIRSALRAFKGVPGRVERVSLFGAGVNGSLPNFSVYVDYAHTPDALEKLYGAFPNTRKICVLGATGGGRDTWKRSVLGEIADTHCAEIILTDEDPYDEDPTAIIEGVAQGVREHTPVIILDRRKAIHEAIARAKAGDVVFITGKGTDPYIMGANGKKTPWSDAEIAREALKKVV